MVKHSYKIISVTLQFILVCFAFGVSAKIKLPKVVSSGMVLQRNEPVNIWGWADEGENVTVTFNGKKYQVTTPASKKWIITLPATKEGEAYEMTIEGTNKIVLNDILFGDVFLCSGQSNMEFRMARVKGKYAKEIAESSNTNIRQFAASSSWSLTELEEVKTKGWLAANPQNVLEFSAVAYFFAKSINQKHQIPVGIILSSVGGTPIEAWTSTEGLKEFPDLIAEHNLFSDPAKVSAIKSKDSLLTLQWINRLRTDDKGSITNEKWFQDHAGENWSPMTVPGYWEAQGLKNLDGVVWYKRQFMVPENMAGKKAVLLLGMIEDQDTTYINGMKVGFTTSRHHARRYEIPASLLKAGLNSIVVRIADFDGNGGFIPNKPYRLQIGQTEIDLSGEWQCKVGMVSAPYPKEAITNFTGKPTALYNGMIAPLLNLKLKGVIWYQGENNVETAHRYQKLLPALIKDWRAKWKKDLPFVFVQLPNLGKPPVEPEENAWAELREAQLIALKTPNTGMAVTYDLGEWDDIHPSNKEDVSKRLFLVAENLIYNDRKVNATAPLYQSMKINGDKIEITFTEKLNSQDKELKQFAIAGADKVFKWANAILKDGKLIVSSKAVAQPVAVRYAWARNPEGANFTNEDGVLVSPFRTDNWPGLTEKKSK